MKLPFSTTPLAPIVVFRKNPKLWRLFRKPGTQGSRIPFGHAVIPILPCSAKILNLTACILPLQLQVQISFPPRPIPHPIPTLPTLSRLTLATSWNYTLPPPSCRHIHQENSCSQICTTKSQSSPAVRPASGVTPRFFFPKQVPKSLSPG